MSSEGNLPASLLYLEATAQPAALSPTSNGPVPAGFPIEGIHLGWELLRVAVARGTAPAVCTPRGVWTYRHLRQAVLSVAAALQNDPRYEPGARVITLLPNSLEYIAAFYGTLLAGCVAVPLPHKSEAGTLASILASTSAIKIISSRQTVRARTDLGGLAEESLDLSQPCECGAILDTNMDDATGNELAALFFTSGSTGTPKGVMLSHRNFLANAWSIQAYLEIRETDKPLCVLPFPHAFGNSVLQSHLLAGACVVLDGQTAFPETIVEALRRHHCTSLSGVPDLFRVLLERTSLGQKPLPSLRHMSVAGGSLRRQSALDIASRIAPARFFAMYGQTEATARLAFVPPEHLATLPDGCIGRAIPSVTLQIADDDGQPVAVGVSGELRARGPNVMLGYWQENAATEERIRDGWLMTGDLAVQDADGWITVQGRRSSLVKIAGYRVHPRDLEDFAVRRFGVSQAVAVAYESPSVGTRLALYLLSQPAATALSLSEVLAGCRAELPRHLVPDQIQFVTEFPLNHAMKIDRLQLSDWAARHAAGRQAFA